MASKSTIDIKITGDASKFNKVLGETESKLGKFGSGLASVGKKAGLLVGGLGAGALLAAPKILELGGELDTMGKKADTVFGDSLDVVQGWAKENARAMGLTADQAAGLAANMGDLLKPMGFTAREAAKMATETNDLSGALSAWSNGQYDAAEVSEILTKAMLGERDQLKALGISINEADVKTRLLEKGQQDLTGTQLQQARALATQELIMEKSIDAQKAWADGTMDGIKAQNESRASIEALKEGLVKALYPAIQAMLPLVESFATWLGDNLPGAIEKVKGWFEKNWPKIQATVAAVVNWFKQDALPVIEAVAGFVIEAFNAVKTKVEEYWPAIKQTITDVVEAVKIVVETTVTAIKLFWDQFGSDIIAAAQNAWNAVKGIIEGVIKVIRGIIQTVTSLIKGDWSGVWEGIKTILSGIWDQMKAVVSGAIGAIRTAIMATLGVIGSLWGVAWGALAALVDDVWEGIKSTVSDAISAVVGFLMGLPGRLAAAVSGAFAAVFAEFGPIVGILQKIIDTAKSAIEWLGKVNPMNLLDRGIDVQGVIDQANSSSYSRPQVANFATSERVNPGVFSQTASRSAASSPRAARVVQPVTKVSFAGANFYGTSMPQDTMNQIAAEVDRQQRLAA